MDYGKYQQTISNMPELPGHLKKMLLYLAWLQYQSVQAQNRPYAYVKQETMANRFEKSRETITRNITRLKKLGFLDVEKSPTGVNRYYLHTDAFFLAHQTSPQTSHQTSHGKQVQTEFIFKKNKIVAKTCEQTHIKSIRDKNNINNNKTDNIVVVGEKTKKIGLTERSYLTLLKRHGEKKLKVAIDYVFNKYYLQKVKIGNPGGLVQSLVESVYEQHKQVEQREKEKAKKAREYDEKRLWLVEIERTQPELFESMKRDIADKNKVEVWQLEEDIKLPAQEIRFIEAMLKRLG